jgi:hypothetical protein
VGFAAQERQRHVAKSQKLGFFWTPEQEGQQSMSTAPIDRRLALLRAGQLNKAEIADFAADAGTQNFVEAEPDINQLLDDVNPIVRFNALATLAYEWGRTSRLDRIKAIARDDTDRDCRRQAVGALGSLFRGRRDKAVLQLLSEIANDDKEEQDVRAFAYTAALDVLGMPRAQQPSPIALRGDDEMLRVLEQYLHNQNAD